MTGYRRVRNPAWTVPAGGPSTKEAGLTCGYLELGVLHKPSTTNIKKGTHKLRDLCPTVPGRPVNGTDPLNSQE